MLKNSNQSRLSRKDLQSLHKESIEKESAFKFPAKVFGEFNSPFFSRSLSNFNRKNTITKYIVDGNKGKRRSRSEGCDKNYSFWSSVGRNTWSIKYPKFFKEDNEIHELKPIWHLRAFNNWAKSSLMLQGVVKFRDNLLIGLDLGCGQGGDLKKWFHCGIKHLYLVESNFTAMMECRRRYIPLRRSWSNFYDATFLQKDFTSEILNIPKVVDVISSQMSIHKAFESKAKAERMAYNVAQSLKCGGSFVVSLTNANKIIDYLRNSPEGKLFGNSIYQVHLLKPLPKTKDIPEFGVRFEFNVGSNKFEEFLVQVPVLEKVMAKHGLILEEQKSFLEMYFSARRNPELVKCMQKMGVVRWGYCKKDKKKVYLTMSAEEREAASLYQALIFRKVFK